MFDTSQMTKDLGKKLGDTIDKELDSEVLDTVAATALRMVGEVLIAASDEIEEDTNE